MNVLTVSGRLGQNAEVRSLKENKKVANFSVAIQREYKNADGKYEADFFDCVYFNPPDFVIPRLEKGARVLINGHIRKETYEKDGVKKSVAKIFVSRIEFLDKKEIVEEKADDRFVQESDTKEDDTDVPF